MSDKNKMIVIDGVCYELSPADLEQLHQILSRARTAVPEKLTDDVVNRLVGHTNVLYYNFETNAWNTAIYNGYRINDQTSGTEYALAFKNVILAIGREYEFVAPVIMTIDSKFYPGRAETISNPPYSARGASVVGNIIVKNKTTGKYELYGKPWVGVRNCDYPAEAVNLGLCWFAYYAGCFKYYGASGYVFRAALIAAHER